MVIQLKLRLRRRIVKGEGSPKQAGNLTNTMMFRDADWGTLLCELGNFPCWLVFSFLPDMVFWLYGIQLIDRRNCSVVSVLSFLPPPFLLSFLSDCAIQQMVCALTKPYLTGTLCFTSGSSFFIPFNKSRKGFTTTSDACWIFLGSSTGVQIKLAMGWKLSVQH